MGHGSFAVMQSCFFRGGYLLFLRGMFYFSEGGGIAELFLLGIFALGLLLAVRCPFKGFIQFLLQYKLSDNIDIY